MVGNYIFPLGASNLLTSAKFKEDQESSKKHIEKQVFYYYRKES